MNGDCLLSKKKQKEAVEMGDENVSVLNLNYEPDGHRKRSASESHTADLVDCKKFRRENAPASVIKDPPTMSVFDVYVGRLTSKFFDGVAYAGKVVSAERVKSEVWYKVRYEDGDEEELTLAEVNDSSVIICIIISLHTHTHTHTHTSSH